MQGTEARGWGKPCSGTYTSVVAGGVKFKVRTEVAPLVAGFVAEVTAGGYHLDRVNDDWGYACRKIRGSCCSWSNHAWGLAIDLNATTNPMTSDGKVHTDMPAWVVEAGRKWGFSWGGDYVGKRKDPMHFEFLGTPADAASLVAKLCKPTAPPIPKRPPVLLVKKGSLERPLLQALLPLATMMTGDFFLRGLEIVEVDPPNVGSVPSWSMAFGFMLPGFESIAGATYAETVPMVVNRLGVPGVRTVAAA